MKNEISYVSDTICFDMLQFRTNHHGTVVSDSHVFVRVALDHTTAHTDPIWSIRSVDLKWENSPYQSSEKLSLDYVLDFLLLLDLWYVPAYEYSNKSKQDTNHTAA